jgi:hypothetical protein
MSHILTLNEFLNKKNYTIDWSLFEHDIINEKIHIVPTQHAYNDRFNPEKISMQDVEELINYANAEIIDSFHRNHKITKDEIKNNTFVVRDRREGNVIDNNPNRYGNREYYFDEDENQPMAIVGALLDYPNILNPDLKNNHFRRFFYNMNIDRNKTFSNMKVGEPLEVFIKVETDGQEISFKPGDYIFKVITCRRKRRFVQNNTEDTLIDVYDDKIQVY